MKHGTFWWPMAAVAVAGLALATAQPLAQGQPTPNAKNDLPNPYRTVEGWAKMPEGRTWGSTSSVDIDKDGTSVWVGERCGTNSCLSSTLDPVLKFDKNGALEKSFGSGLVATNAHPPRTASRTTAQTMPNAGRPFAVGALGRAACGWTVDSSPDPSIVGSTSRTCPQHRTPAQTQALDTVHWSGPRSEGA